MIVPEGRLVLNHLSQPLDSSVAMVSSLPGFFHHSQSSQATPSYVVAFARNHKSLTVNHSLSSFTATEHHSLSPCVVVTTVNNSNSSQSSFTRTIRRSQSQVIIYNDHAHMHSAPARQVIFHIRHDRTSPTTTHPSQS